MNRGQVIAVQQLASVLRSRKSTWSHVLDSQDAARRTADQTRALLLVLLASTNGWTQNAVKTALAQFDAALLANRIEIEWVDEEQWWTAVVRATPAVRNWLLRCPPELEHATLALEETFHSGRSCRGARQALLETMQCHGWSYVEWHRACRAKETASEFGRILKSYLEQRPAYVPGRRRGTDLRPRKPRGADQVRKAPRGSRQGIWA